MYLNSKAFTGGENDIPRLHQQAMADLRVVVDKWKPEDFSPDDYEIVSGSVIQRLPCLDGRFAVHAYNIFTPKT